MCVRVCGEGGQAQKIPLKQICIGFQCYSRLSGTLVQMYLSMSVQTVENKLIFYSPSLLIPPLLLIFFPRCHSASISVLHASFSPFRHAIARTKIVLKFILCVLFSWQYYNLNWYARSCFVGVLYRLQQLQSEIFWSTEWWNARILHLKHIL